MQEKQKKTKSEYFTKEDLEYMKRHDLTEEDLIEFQRDMARQDAYEQDAINKEILELKQRGLDY